MLSNSSMVKWSKEVKMPELYTISEVCKILKCHPNTLRQWDAKGILSAIRIGEKKMMRYSAEEILKFLKKNKKDEKDEK